MARSNGRIVWRWTDTAGDRHTTSRRPAKSRLGAGRPRAYADLRDFRSVGGGIEALIPPGDRQATSDPELAEHLAAERADELRRAKQKQVVLGVRRTARLKAFAAEHLEAKVQTEDVSTGWMSAAQRHLEVACEFFGSGQELTAIRPADVREYVEHLKRQPNGRGGTLSNQTARHYLNSLSNLFRRAVAEELVLRNPVSALLHKPRPARSESDWLEQPEMALLLESARTYEPRVDDGAIPFVHPLIATFALTGARKKAVLGLQVSEVSFDRKTVRFKPNSFRGLKTLTSNRTVPLWPQLETVLREYVFGGDGPKRGLLFPSPRSEGMLTDLRKQLDAVGDRAGFETGRIRTKLFRHTYCATRLQTLDGGQPVSPYTVARELGHSSTHMVERVYSHLGQIRYRAEEVRFDADEFADELGERLVELHEGAS